jgi:aconitate decarboxylase
MSAHDNEETDGVTKQLSRWLETFSWDDIPEDVRTRAKYLILDGLACGIVGSHLPWTEKAANTFFEMEPTGTSIVWGYSDKVRIPCGCRVSRVVAEYPVWLQERN